MTSLKIADLQRDAYTEGREEGISIGAYEKALETARKLIARGDSLEVVAELLDLSLLEVQRLMNN